jgi:tetratricopeptide (TPR) repeat protein
MNEHSTENSGNDIADSEFQLVVSLATNGEWAAARERASRITNTSVASRAWRALGEMNANTQRWELALADMENALRFDPNSRQLRLARAALLDRAGDGPAALAEFEALAFDGIDSASLALHLAALLAAADRLDEAEDVLATALRQWPADAQLHARLARIRWQRGAGLESMRALERAIESHPRELPLRLVAADLLRSAGESALALELLERGLELAPGSAIFHTSIGALLEGSDRADEALPRLRAAQRLAPRSVSVRRNLVPTLLRTGAVVEALALLRELLAELPDDQMLLAQYSTALRLAGDAEYRGLCDYARLVKTCVLQPAPEFANIGVFNAAFAHELARLHRGREHPLEQSLRGGSQTERHLPRDNPMIAAFFTMLDAPIREYIAALRPDATHPVDRRRGDGYRIAGSWSVRLRPGGFHIDHVHPLGWLSSAYYVSLPDVSDENSRAGWLRFGQPGLRLTGCGPEWFVRPEAGMLALFPSYFWHGTVPFERGGQRLTAAFDVVPA